jgi:lipoprotein-anchoring transpeptidase ErfK/SrfK
MRRSRSADARAAGHARPGLCHTQTMGSSGRPRRQVLLRIIPIGLVAVLAATVLVTDHLDPRTSRHLVAQIVGGPVTRSATAKRSAPARAAPRADRSPPAVADKTAGQAVKAAGSTVKRAGPTIPSRSAHSAGSRAAPPRTVAPANTSARWGATASARAPHPGHRGRVTATVPTTGWVATLRRTTPYAAHPGGAPAGRLAAKNPFGQQMVLGIVGAPRRSGWAEIELPIRPDGSTGWIRTRRVQLSRTSYWIDVDLARRLLTVGDGAHVLLRTSVAVGAAATPTPTGRTFVWESLRLEDPHGAYGPYILGLAMYSDALRMFNGGDAQIGIHGNDEPATIGEAASNGCVRLPNALIARLVRLLPLGTPVTIVA